LENWTRLESIVDRTRYLGISKSLLESNTLGNLKYLEVYFSCICEAGDDFHQQRHDKLKELLSNIQNVPLLQHVKFGYTPMQLADLEELHKQLTKLELTLQFVYLYNNEDSGDENKTLSSVKNTANSMKILSFNLYIMDDSDDIVGNNDDIHPSFERCIRT
jgi:hypothetical protein